MPLRETEAIVLRSYRLGEADKVVSLFTRQFGRLRAAAGGAQRPKSRYGGTLEPLSYLRIWLFERENRDLLRLNSAELIESFFDMQREYRLQLAAQYIAEVAERLLPEREVNEQTFRLLLAVLRSLKASGEVDRPLLYLNYWLLRLGGVLPSLEQCSECGQPLGETGGFYGQGSEGLLCDSCRRGCRDLGGRALERVSAASLALASMLRQTSLDRWQASGSAPEGCREARRFFEEVVENHAGKRLVTRPLLAQEVE
jgi:DNA repair protein RecO (recombination protein O)